MKLTQILFSLAIASMSVDAVAAPEPCELAVQELRVLSEVARFEDVRMRSMEALQSCPEAADIHFLYQNSILRTTGARDRLIREYEALENEHSGDAFYGGLLASAHLVGRVPKDTDFLVAYIEAGKEDYGEAAWPYLLESLLARQKADSEGALTAVMRAFELQPDMARRPLIQTLLWNDNLEEASRLCVDSSADLLPGFAACSYLQRSKEEGAGETLEQLSEAIELWMPRINRSKHLPPLYEAYLFFYDLDVLDAQSHALAGQIRERILSLNSEITLPEFNIGDASQYRVDVRAARANPELAARAEAYEQLLEQVDDEQKLRLHSLAAETYLHPLLKDSEAALVHLNGMMALGQVDAATVLQIVEWLLEEDRNSEALSISQQAFEVFSQDQVPWAYLRGESRFEIGENYYFGSLADLHFARGLAYLGSEQPEMAVLDLITAQKVQPRFPGAESYVTTIQYHLALAELASNRQQSAFETLLEAAQGDGAEQTKAMAKLQEMWPQYSGTWSSLEALIQSETASEPNEQQEAEGKAAPNPLYGQTAPLFEIETLEGESLKLEELRGKPVVLSFWATWCGPCMSEMPYLIALQNEWADKVTIVGLATSDTEEKVREFAAKGDISVTLAMSTEDIDKNYAVTGLPTLYILDSKGVVKKAHIGFDSKSMEQLRTEVEGLLP